jgi:hypothetical protein
MFICLGGCLLAVCSVWLYDVEHSLKGSEDAAGPTAEPPPGGFFVRHRTTDGSTTLEPAAKTRTEMGIVAAAESLRKMPDSELAQRAKALEACLRAPQERGLDALPSATPADKPQWARETEFRQTLPPEVVSLANELLFRLGRVEAPSGVRALPIKLGAAMIASKKPAGPRPTSALAHYLAFLAEQLSQRNSQA